MRLFLWLAFVTTFGSALAATKHSACCVCIEDPNDASYTAKTCQRWFKENSQRLGCQQDISIKDPEKPTVDSSLRCDRLEVQAEFHGLSYMYHVPARIADSLTIDLKPKVFNYDGSTCLLFNNLSKARNEIATLGQRYSQVSYKFRGNQNAGVTEMLAFIGKPKEMPEAASKATVTTHKGKTSVSYDSCSAKGKLCYFTSDDFEADNDSNTKNCMSAGVLVGQVCCRPSKTAGEGKWSAPGKACAR